MILLEYQAVRSKFIYCHQTSKLNRDLFNELLDID